MFYKSAKAKGIVVKSRFVGVSHNLNGRKHHWLAQYQENGKKLMFERFPFTEQGEKDAAQKYLNFTSLHEKTIRRKVKTQFKTQTDE